MPRVRVTIRNLDAVNATKERLRQVVFASLLDLDADVRDASPVDTGYFVNSWFAQANGAPPAGVGVASQDRGGSDPSVIMDGIGGVVSLVNTAEYAGPLADGHSPQAPAGWVEAAAAKFEDHIQKHIMLSEGGS